VTKEESAGAAVPETGAKLPVETRASQKVLEKGTRAEVPHPQLKLERTHLEDTVRCWVTREKGQADFFQNHQESAIPANQQLLGTASLGTIGGDS